MKSQETEYIYWEHQSKYSQLCAVHCINSLLQGPFVNVSTLKDIAKKLDDMEKNLLIAQGINLGEEFTNMDDTGNFNIQVIIEALKTFNVEIIPMKTNECQQILMKNDNSLEGIIFNSSRHWFCIRKINNVWYNLNSANQLPGPQIISEFYMDAFIKGTEEIGFTNFMVKNIPPLPDFKSEIFLKLNCFSQYLVPIEEVRKNKNKNSEIMMEDEDDEMLKKALALSKSEFANNGSNMEEQIKILKENLQDKDDEYDEIMKSSKNDYFKELEGKIPKEPEKNDDCYFFLFKVPSKNASFQRRFLSSNKVEDIQNFIKFQIKDSTDLFLFTEKDSIFLFEPNQEIKDLGISHDEIILCKTDNEL